MRYIETVKNCWFRAVWTIIHMLKNYNIRPIGYPFLEVDFSHLGLPDNCLTLLELELSFDVVR